jgi:hypothetical protein
MDITTTERDLGDGRVFITQTGPNMYDRECTVQGVRQTLPDGSILDRAVYQSDLDRIAQLDGTAAAPWVPTEPVTLEMAVQIADEWTPGCGKWAAFNDTPQEPNHYRWVWNAAAMLARANDKGDAGQIATRRRSLELAIESWIDAGKLTEPAPEEFEQAAPEAHQGLSLGAKCAIGFVGGVALGCAIRKGHIGRALTSAAVYSVARPAFSQLFKAATR